MSMMDKLKRILKGHEEQTPQGVQDRPQGDQGGRVDKGPDALREQMRSQQDRDNPPQP
ncbi:antitoxin [Streptomyces nodosus]